MLTLPARLTRSHADTLESYLRRSLDNRGRLIMDCVKVAAVDENCFEYGLDREDGCIRGEN